MMTVEHARKVVSRLHKNNVESRLIYISISKKSAVIRIDYKSFVFEYLGDGVIRCIWNNWGNAVSNKAMSEILEQVLKADKVNKLGW